MTVRAAKLMAATFLFAIATLALTSSALAHAPITLVAWDNAANPSRLVATAAEEISNAPSDYYLRVFNPAGARVDRNDALVTGNNTQITVGVPSGLPSGTYRVEWKTVSEDGDELTGSLSIAFTAPSTPSTSPTSAPAPAAAPAASAATPVTSTAAAPHSHDDEDEHSPQAAAPSTPTQPVTFEARLSGANIVPTPVSSTANAFARFTFNPANNRLDYTVWVYGVSADQITGLHVHRGGATETGGHALEILSTGPTDKLVFTGTDTLGSVDVTNLINGRLYLQLHTKAYQPGAARAQLILPRTGAAADSHDAHDHGTSGQAPVTARTTSATVAVRPPNTGDGGLLVSTNRTSSAGWPVAALLAIFAATTLAPVALRARSRS